MKKLVSLFLLLIVFAVSGCATVSLDPGKAVSLTHIHIVVPVYAQPLNTPQIHTNIALKLPALNPIYPRETIRVRMLQQREVDHLFRLLNENKNWKPAVVIAKEIKHQLVTMTNYPVSIDPEPFRNYGEWSYGHSEPSLFDYSDQPTSGAVMEVNLYDYKLYDGLLYLGLWTRLVNPASGSVMAKSTCFSTSLHPLWYPFADRITHWDYRELLSNNAAEFKELFRARVRKLVPECIEKLGLHKK